MADLELPPSAIRALATKCGLSVRDTVNSSAGVERLKLNRVTITGKQAMIVWDDKDAPEDCELCVIWDQSVNELILTELIVDSIFNTEA